MKKTFNQLMADADRSVVQARVDKLRRMELQLIDRFDNTIGVLERSEIWRDIEDVRGELAELLPRLRPTTLEVAVTCAIGLLVLPILTLVLPAVFR